MRDERRVMVHVPLAGDIAATSAALLFSEHPQVKIPEAHRESPDLEAQKTQGRLDEIIARGEVFSKLLEAAEVASALGGVFLKVNWDEELARYPLLSIAQADQALPEFEFGLLKAVTFWRVLEEEENGKVWRLLERHERGVIENGLYVGRDGRLGERMPLSARADTERLAPVVLTGVDGLACRYIPNMRPNRLWRGSALGQSDYAGSEGLMDSLDEVFTSLLRDVRLGVGRILAPEEFFQSDGQGTVAFDLDREAYVGLHVPLAADSAKGQITVSQFEIRTDQHLRASTELVGQIITNAGYSPQSFGLQIEGRAESGTALNIRERKSFSTSAKKGEYWRNALADIFEIMLTIDMKHLRSGVIPFRPVVEIQDSVRPDIAQTAQTVEMLNRAQAASVQTKVTLLHPDWSKEQVEAEVGRIVEESGEGTQKVALGDTSSSNN